MNRPSISLALKGKLQIPLREAKLNMQLSWCLSIINKLLVNSGQEPKTYPALLGRSPILTLCDSEDKLQNGLRRNRFTQVLYRA